VENHHVHLAGISLVVLMIADQVLKIFVISFLANIQGKIHIVYEEFLLKDVKFFGLESSNLGVVRVLVVKVIIKFACNHQTCQNHPMNVERV